MGAMMLMINRIPGMLFMLALCSLQALADPEPVNKEEDLTPLRLSYMDGAVSFLRPGAEDWTAARLNTPLAAGDGLYTGGRASVELQLGSRAFIRAGGDSQLTLVNQESAFVQFTITGGRVSLDLRALPADYTVEVDTPDAVFTIQQPGYYRLDVDNETHFITRRGGVATVIPAGGEAQGIQPSEDVVVQERLGTTLIAAGRVDEGEFALSQLADQFARAKQPKNVARLQVLLGRFAEARGDLALAKQRFLAAYQIDPTQATTLAALAHLAVEQNDGQNARKYYRTLLLQAFDEKAVGLSKAQIYLALGKLHQEAGELPKARNMFERGLEIDGKNGALRQALAALPK